jgi:tRNA(Ile)-lysidine synthase
MVKKYCYDRRINFETIDVLYYQKYGNFEAWARDVRYTFFKEIAVKYSAEAVFVAHHLDDLLETYLIQKRRRNIVKYYGLKEETNLLGIKIIRPLLSLDKKDLLAYCEFNKLPFSIDSTNLENNHLRNKIRNKELKLYSDKEKLDLLEEIKLKNLNRKKNLEVLENFSKIEKISIEEFLKLEDVEKQLIIYEIITNKTDINLNKLSWYRINDLIRILQSKKPNVCIQLSGSYYFIREYDYFYVDKIEEKQGYSYVMEKPGIIDNERFYCDFTCDTSQLKIYESSYPLTFRNVEEKDKVKIGNLTKKVNRLLIEEKIPLKDRKEYPIVLDKEGNVVYIPLYRSETQKTIANKLKFMLK